MVTTHLRETLPEDDAPLDRDDAPRPRGNLVRNDPHDDVPDDEPESYNLSGIDSRIQFEKLAPGEYPASVTAVEYKRSAKRNLMLAWTITVFFQRADGSDGERKRYFYTVLDEKGFPKLVRAVTAVNPSIDMEDFRPREAVYELVGQPCMVKIVLEDDDRNPGEKRDVIKEVLPPRPEIKDYYRD